MTPDACIALLHEQLQALRAAVEDDRFEEAADLMAAHGDRLATLDLTLLQPSQVQHLQALLQGQQNLMQRMQARRDAARDGMVSERRAHRAAGAYLAAESLA